jgi:hypothetical protein
MDQQNQIELEQLFSKNQTVPKLRAFFDTDEWMSYLEAVEIPKAFGLDLLAQMALHRKADMSTLVGLLHRHFEDEYPVLQDALQACCDMIWKAAECDLIDVFESITTFLYRYDVTAEIWDELDRFQYPLPMVVPPRVLESNDHNAYLTLRSYPILNNTHRNLGRHNDDLCLDHLNRVNQIPLVINADTARAIKNSWCHLDKPKPGESRKKFEARVRAFEKYDTVGKEVIEMLYMTGEPFWLTHRYDSRGRCYAQGYHVNPQGNDWNKAVVELANQELVTS